MPSSYISERATPRMTKGPGSTRPWKRLPFSATCGCRVRRSSLRAWPRHSIRRGAPHGSMRSRRCAMCRHGRRCAISSVMLALLVPAMAFAVEETAISLKGYYKNLLVDSRTAFPQVEDYTLDLNRLRLELRGRPVPWFGYEVQYDNEALLGNYLDTAQFAQIKTAKPATYWDLEDAYLDRGTMWTRC